MRCLRAVLLLSAVFACSAPPAERPVCEYASRSEGLPAVGQWKCNPAFGDVDGDGLKDLAAMPRKGRGAKVWRYGGETGWIETSHGLAMEASTGGGVDFGDVNHDGLLDLAVADHSKGIYVFLGDGKGGWSASSQGLPEMQSDDVALGDLDGDGHLDLCACSAADEGVGIFFGDGQGSWRKAPRELGFPENGSGHEIALGDVNHDGIIDVAVTMVTKPCVWVSAGPSKWVGRTEDFPELQWGGQYWGVSLGDVNHDGHLDIALGRIQGGPEVYLGDGRGGWSRSISGIAGPASAWGVALGDVDGDGHLDLVVSGKIDRDELGDAYGVFIYRGDGKGGWSALRGTGLPERGLFQSWGLCVDDIDGDGWVEIAGGFGISHSQEPPDFLNEGAEKLPRAQGKNWGPGGGLVVWRRIR